MLEREREEADGGGGVEVWDGRREEERSGDGKGKLKQESGVEHQSKPVAKSGNRFFENFARITVQISRLNIFQLIKACQTEASEFIRFPDVSTASNNFPKVRVEMFRMIFFFFVGWIEFNI